jgi:hypothetical protein
MIVYSDPDDHAEGKAAPKDVEGVDLPGSTPKHFTLQAALLA